MCRGPDVESIQQLYLESFAETKKLVNISLEFLTDWYFGASWTTA